MNEQQERNHRRVLAKANNRGEKAVEWFKTNKLTRETQPEFNRIMKLADKEFDKNYNQPRQ